MDVFFGGAPQSNYAYGTQMASSRHAVTSLPGQYCADSVFKRRDQHKIAALVAMIFWLHCTMGGSGDVSSIYFREWSGLVDSCNHV